MTRDRVLLKHTTLNERITRHRFKEYCGTEQEQDFNNDHNTEAVIPEMITS